MVPGCTTDRTPRQLPPAEGPTQAYSFPSVEVSARTTVPARAKVPLWAKPRADGTELESPGLARVGISLYRSQGQVARETNRLLNTMAEAPEAFERVGANGWTGFRRRIAEPNRDRSFVSYTLTKDAHILDVRASWVTTDQKSREEADLLVRHILFSLEPLP